MENGLKGRRKEEEMEKKERKRKKKDCAMGRNEETKKGCPRKNIP